MSQNGAKPLCNLKASRHPFLQTVSMPQNFTPVMTPSCENGANHVWGIPAETTDRMGSSCLA